MINMHHQNQNQTVEGLGRRSVISTYIYHTHYHTFHTIDNEFIEGAVCCLLCRLPGGVGHKRTLLFGHNVEVADLTKLVEMVPVHQREKTVLLSNHNRITMTMNV